MVALTTTLCYFWASASPLGSQYHMMLLGGGMWGIAGRHLLGNYPLHHASSRSNPLSLVSILAGCPASPCLPGMQSSACRAHQPCGWMTFLRFLSSSSDSFRKVA